jgi:hypothetical protein
MIALDTPATTLFGIPLTIDKLPLLVAAAEQHGWTSHIKSTFSHVLARPGTVVKLFRDPAYFHYLRYAVHPDNPAFPRLEALHVGPDVSAAFLERLVPVSAADNGILTDLAITAHISHGHIDPRNAEVRQFARRFGIDALDALQDIVSLASALGYSTDLWPKNFLIRPATGQLIFADPLCIRGFVGLHSGAPTPSRAVVR